MYDLDVIKHAAIQRIKNEPADIFLTAPVGIFNQAWNVFAEAITRGPDEYAKRFAVMEQSVVNGLVPLDTAHGSIHQATRYASMAYLTCGLAMAEQQQNAAQIPHAKVTRTISAAAHKIAVMNKYVHAFMNDLHAKRSYAVNPLNPDLREALVDYYSVVIVALLEIKPYASKAPDMQLVIDGVINDSSIIARNTGLALKIPGNVQKRAAPDVAINSSLVSAQFPVASSHSLIPYHPETNRTDILRAAYKAPPAAPTPEPARPSATLLDLEVGREQRAKRRLVEAAKRANPTDPGHTPKPG